jgi:hypothetical protein
MRWGGAGRSGEDELAVVADTQRQSFEGIGKAGWYCKYGPALMVDNVVGILSRIEGDRDSVAAARDSKQSRVRHRGHLPHCLATNVQRVVSKGNQERPPTAIAARPPGARLVCVLSEIMGNTLTNKVFCFKSRSFSGAFYVRQPKNYANWFFLLSNFLARELRCNLLRFVK